MPILDSLRKLFQRPPEIRMPRRWPRILMTDATTVMLTGGRRETVNLANLSAGGARVQSTIPFGVRDRLTLQLALAAGSHCSLDAEVVYCKRDAQGMHYAGGLRFIGATRDGIAEISAFIAEEHRRRSGAGETWHG
jgi:hypothetical protein